ncbi:MAG: hypothetical protein H0U67_04470 [Gemmatimonadetes bacterium]|nr:hypothetical protein [Gemmatimonadota bacterium]
MRHAGSRTLQGLPAGLMIVVLFLNLPVFLPLADARVGWIPNTIHSIKPSAWATAVGLYDADRYTAARVRPYSAVQFMNAELAPDARVVTFSEASHFYTRAEMLHDYSRSVAAGTWGARRPGSEDEAYRSLRAAGVTHILWDKVRQDIDDDDFAVRSPAFRERYTRRVYEDALVELDELL